MDSSLLNKFDIDNCKFQFKNSPGFPHFCLDNFLDEEFALKIHDSFPSYKEAADVGVTYRAINEKRKVQVSDCMKYPTPIKKLYDLLVSKEFVALISEMSGIENLIADPNMSGGGIHATNTGGHLDVHIDFNYNEELALHRRLNLLIYFNKDWDEEFGGYLDLWDKDVKNCIGSFAPTFNRLAGFATGSFSWHGVTPINCPMDRMRKSFAIYYYTKEAPSGWDGIKHNTIFKARPKEHLKGKLLMPSEKLAHYLFQLIKKMIFSAKHLKNKLR